MYLEIICSLVSNLQEFLIIFLTYLFQWQQAGESIAMDADATSLLQKIGVAPTDDSRKYIWNKVRQH